MIRVGIMSMQRIANYGSFLQAYALKRLIEEMGCHVEFVDYHIGKTLIEEKRHNDNRFVRSFSKVVETFFYRAPLLHKISFIKYKRMFMKKYMPILGVSEEMNYNPELDVLVIGSDEVFNCIQSNSNVGYSLELFGKDNNAKRLITYGASFGNTTLNKLDKYEKKDEIAKLLKRIDIISVRDENSANIVQELTGKKPIYNLDPVLMFDYMKNSDIIPRIKCDERYLVLYAYSGRITDKEADWISNYAKDKGLRIFSIGGIQRCADRFIDCSPFEVLSYFSNAEEIITDTFHGSIFSIITHRPFATLVRKSVGDSYGNEEKISDLLSRLGLLDRMTTEISEVAKINQTKIQFSQIDDTLQSRREETKRYLKENIIGS